MCCVTLWQSRNAALAADITTQIHEYKARIATDGTQIDARLHLAKIYLQIEAYAEAAEQYRQIIAIIKPNLTPKTTTTTANPQISTVYYGLGLAYTGLENFENAIALYQQAIEAAPNRAHLHAALASTYVHMHRYTEALDNYKAAIALDPNDEMIQHQLGNVYSKRGESAEAIRHQLQALAINPQFANAHYQLGTLYTSKKLWTEAINAYRAAYANDPTLIQALYNLAQAYFRAGNPAAAHEQMKLFQEKKATLEPLHRLRGALQRTQETAERARILSNIGRFYLKNGQYEQAIREYQKALGINPKLVPAYSGIGMAYAMLEKYAEATTAQQKALELQPNFAKAHAGLGLVYLRQHQTTLALEHYRQAVTLDPQSSEAHLKIGLILMRQQRYREATEVYQTIIAIKPDDPEAYHNLGLCYAHQARETNDTPQNTALTTAALAALQKAVDLSLAASSDLKTAEQPHIKPVFLKETYYLIGDLQAEQGDFSTAEAAYLASALPKAYHALAQLNAKAAHQHRRGPQQKTVLQKARYYALKAIQLKPQTASYYNTLALIDFQRRDYLQAKQAIQKALEIDPNNQNYQQGLKQISKKFAAE